MKKQTKNIFSFYINVLFIILSCQLQYPQSAGKPDWINFARISGNGLGSHNIEAIMERVKEHGALGIELDNDITGRYDSFLDPKQKLDEIRKAAEAAHAIGNYAFIYIAGLECITENADKTDRTMYKQHPDWVQRNIQGDPAIFTGGIAFWVDKGDEDMWISPYAPDWRKIYMERVRQIAATGIDGIYIDVAYWMTHYTGWENTWASFDDYTIGEFKKRTGIDAEKDFMPGDFNDPDFLKWVDFRIQTITEFFEEINKNVKSVNPACLTIPEIYPGIDEASVIVGPDVYEIYKFSDVITHEFFVNTNTGAKRNTFDWLTYILGINTFRIFAEGKPTWLLSYSWDGEKGSDSTDAMKLLSCAEVMAGGNFWDAPGHWMAGSNDYSTRKEIFKWIKENEKFLYSRRKPLNPIGVYFSPSARNYFAADYIKSFLGILHLLLNNHFEYEVITPRTLKNFNGSAVILPDVKILNESETGMLGELKDKGVKLIATGETGRYDSLRQKTALNNIAKLSDLLVDECPGKKYYNTKDLHIISAFNELLNQILPLYKPKYKVKASFNISIQPADLADKDCIYITNLKGLKGYSSCIPETEENLEIEFESAGKPEIYFIPYLGNKQKVEEIFKQSADKNIITLKLPPVKFGGLLVIEK